jgi:hypothetical protein
LTPANIRFRGKSGHLNASARRVGSARLVQEAEGDNGQNRISKHRAMKIFKQIGDLTMKLLTFDVPRFGQTYCKFPTKEEYGEV